MSDADRQKYEKAFPVAAASLCCPDTTADADTNPEPCAGCELAISLDFDANGNNIVGHDAPYTNWTPTGNYSGDFNGNNNKITNLMITRTADAADIGLFGRVASGGVITGVGLVDVNITTSGSGGSRVGALAGHFNGTARGVYATGTLSHTGTGSGGYFGGLIGYTESTIAASWSGVHASSAGANANVGGIIGSVHRPTMTAVYSSAQYPPPEPPPAPTRGTSAQSSLEMGMPSSNGNYPVVGEMAGVCLLEGPPPCAPPRRRN